MESHRFFRQCLLIALALAGGLLKGLKIQGYDKR
jgi:hypothetical protein